MPLGCMVHIQTLTFLSLGGDRWNKTALGLVVSDVSMEDKKHEDFRQKKKKKGFCLKKPFLGIDLDCVATDGLGSPHPARIILYAEHNLQEGRNRLIQAGGFAVLSGPRVDFLYFQLCNVWNACSPSTPCLALLCSLQGMIQLLL